MQVYDWVSQVALGSGILMGMRSIFKIGTYFYVAYTQNLTTSFKHVVLRFNDDWTGQTTIDDETLALTYADYNHCPPCISYFENGGNTYIYIKFGASLIAHPHTSYGNTCYYNHTTSTLTTALGALATFPSIDGMVGMDLIRFTSGNSCSIVQSNDDDPDNPHYAQIRFTAWEAAAGEASHGYLIEDGTLQATYLYDNGANVLLRKNDSVAGFSTIETICATDGNMEFEHALYTEWGSYRVATWPDKLLIDYGDATWLPYAVSGNPVPHWDASLNVIAISIGNIMIKYDTDRDQILIFQMETAVTGMAGWENVIVSTAGTIYALELVTTDQWKSAIIAGVVMQDPRELTMLTTQEPTTNQMYQFYNNADVLRYTGRLQTYKDKIGLYEVKLLCPIWADLDQEISYDPAGNTADVILKDILDTYCMWLSYGASTIDDTVIKTYNEPWVSIKIGQIIREIAKSEGMWFWYDEGNMELYLQNGVASGLTIVDTTDAIIFPTDPLEKIPVPKSNFVLEGKWDYTTSTRYSVSSITDAAAIPYYDEFPNADDTELAAILANLKGMINLTVTYIRLAVLNKALRLGHSFALTLAKWSIAADTYYVQECHEDLLKNTVQLVVVSAISIPKESPQQKTDAKIVNLKQNLDETNKTIGSLIYQDTAGDFKNKFADRWGTTAGVAPSGITDNGSACTVEASNDGHTFNIVSTLADADDNISKAITATDDLYFSYWAKVSDVTKATWLVRLHKGGVGTSIGFYVSGSNLCYYPLGGAATAICAMSNDTWYHLAIIYNRNAASYLFVNGTLAVVYTVSDNAIDTIFLNYKVDATQTTRFDAFYYGSSWKAMWSSLYESMVMNDERWTQYGERRLHLLDFKDRSANDWIGVTSTDNDEAVLDLVNGVDDHPAAGFSWSSVTDNLTNNRIPPGCKAVLLKVVVTITSANVSNYVFIRREGNTNIYQSLWISSASANNYETSNNGIVSVDKDGKINVFVNRAAGDIYVYISILGYEL